MVQIQIDLPEKIDKIVAIHKVKLGVETKAEAVINIIQRFADAMEKKDKDYEDEYY